MIIGFEILNSISFIKSQRTDEGKIIVDKITSEIFSKSSMRDTAGLLSLAGRYYSQAEGSLPDSSLMSDLYYFSGVCYLLGNDNKKALSNLIKANGIKTSLGIKDDRYLKSIYNIGVAYNFTGDFNNSSFFLEKFIKEGKDFFGKNSPDVASAYMALIGALIENKDYDKVRFYTLDILEILKNNSSLLTYQELSDLYQNIGVGYLQISDYAKGRIYLEMALEYHEKSRSAINQNYINLINNLATTYGYLGLNEKEAEFFEKGISLAVSNNSDLAFNLINSYAIDLGDNGKADKGERLLSDVVRKAKSVFGTDSRYYINVLSNYAEYLRDYMNDADNSIPLFKICLAYLEEHKEQVLLRDPVITGYSLAVSSKGESRNALEMIQDLLFEVSGSAKSHGLYENPDFAMMKADKRMLRILRSKHKILEDIYSESKSPEVLEAAANTSESIISLIDKIRISISEEESRIVLGDRYRDLYIIAIHDFEMCYSQTGEKRFLEKVFEYAERCKAAGLLAATRELNAIQLNIPPDIAGLEKSVRSEISFINSKISKENEKASPERKLLADLNNELQIKIQTRDSLVMTLEKNFPGYYALKYSITAPELKDIPSITGRNANYLNYVVSDSLIYVFLVNRRHQMFITQSIDSGFFLKLNKFRLLLSDPSITGDARKNFNDYQDIGFELYNILIEPVQKYFISDNLLISADNLLSYIPFEVLVTSQNEEKSILYRELNYLMNKYNISYVYSATFFEELVRRKMELNRKLVAFAPIHGNNINIDSIFQKRQVQTRYLSDLKYSFEEAKYVSSLSKGKLYLDRDARESEYKKVAGNYGIIHLAMHTILNDQNPMNSAMVFAIGDDIPEDGLLHTYEVYGIPLRARMVVLSSCNTGAGLLSTGEGILSLARGFLYSGGQSVVMSMWEIDDKSGTDVIKMFYDNLQKGRTKSTALKTARIKYLKNASQLRSHPYYWSSLVIYGDNNPVFSSKRLIIILSAGLLIFAGVVWFYLRKRKYS